MKRLAALVASLSTSAAIGPAAQAKPRKARAAEVAQAPGDVLTAGPDDDDGDGPEAQAAYPIKLDQVIEVAVRQSADLARAKADRAAAKGDAGAAAKDQSWILSMGANYQFTNTGLSPDDASTQPFSTLSEAQLNAQLGIGRKLPTGGSVELDLQAQHTRREIWVPGDYIKALQGSDPSNPNLGSSVPQSTNCGENIDIYCVNQASATVKFTQPVLRGFGPDVATAPQKKAELAATEATLKVQLGAEDMIRQVVSDYWELAYAAYEVDVRAEALDVAKKQEQLTREEMRGGAAPATALNAVLYEIATRSEALLTAKLAHEKKSLDLRRESGLEIGRRQIVLKPLDAFEIGEADWDLNEVLAQSHKVNRRLGDILLQKKIADLDVGVAENGMLPQLDLSVSGSLIGTGDTADAAFSGASGGAGYQVMAGVNVSFELSGAAKSARDAAVARRHRLEIDRLDLERQLDAQVVSSVKTVTSARTRVALSDQAIRVAELNLTAERASFQAQRSTNFNVMQRQTELIDARLRRGRAVADYHEAVAQLQFLSGVILEQYRVNVRPRQQAE